MIGKERNYFNPWFLGAAVSCFLGGVMVAHILADSFKVKKRKKDLPPGLLNIGFTTCYANAILQCFASLESIRIWMGKTSKIVPSAHLHREAHELLQALSNFCEPDVLVVSSEVLLSILQFQDRFQYLSQQDCHEFFQLFCEKLQCVSVSQSKSRDPGLQSGVGFIPNSNTIPKFPLSGRFSSRLRCLACNTVFPTTVEQFVAISLVKNPAKSERRFTSLTELLAVFTDDELLADATCEKCSAKCCLKKQTKIFSAPQVLCLHIARSSWTNHSVTKTVDQITFPDVINLAPFLQYKPSKKFTHLYRLSSVVVHYGSLSSSGHFVAYRQSPSGRKWCYASDEDVRFVDRGTVLSCEPYMLFYEKSTPLETCLDGPSSNDNDLLRKML